MKKILAALAVVAAAATPAMAQTYSAHAAAAPGYVTEDSAGYGAYAYAPGAYGAGAVVAPGVVYEFGRYAGADPDPNVRQQLQNQSDIVDR
jgi:hypothetical protein